MNKIKITVLLCACCVSLLLPITSVSAAEGSQGVTVTYTPSEIATFRMEIVIIGEGSIYDGTQEIVGSTTVYELKYEDKKTFNINPAKRNQLKSIVYDEIDITKQLSDGAITVEQMEYDTKLTITFESIETPGGDEDIPPDEDKPSDDKPIKPDNGNTDSGGKGEVSKPNIKGPSTGDISNQEKWMTIGTLSGMFLLILWKRKKGQEESEEESSQIEKKG